MLLNLIHKGSEKPYADLVCSVVIISVSREVSFDLVVFCKTILITDYLHLCIFDRGKGIDYV